MLACGFSFFLFFSVSKPGPESGSFFIFWRKNSTSGKLKAREKLMSDVPVQLIVTTLTAVSCQTWVYSLCEEPIGEREAGDSRPL